MVNESSNENETSTDDELKEFRQIRDLKVAVKRMQKSNSKVDKRFLDVYRVKRAKEKGLSFALQDEVSKR